MKLFNEDSNNIPVSIQDGGFPLACNDVIQNATNSYLFGIPSILRGWSVILSGCLVSNVNTITQTCNVSEGLVMINDVIYQFTGLTNQSYPFSIVAGDTTPDIRKFADGNFYTVATTYNYSIKTSFSYLNNSSVDTYPDNITTQEIYFDPFSCQRSEYVLRNLGLSINEITQTGNNNFLITLDDLGEPIVGTPVSLFKGTFKYKYFGYNNFNPNSLLKYNNAGGHFGGILGNNISLIKNNIPSHVHQSGTLTAIAGSENNHQHFLNNKGRVGGDSPQNDTASPTELTANGSTVFADTRFSTRLEVSGFQGQHTHLINGATESGVLGGLLDTPTPFNVENYYTGVTGWQWLGYQSQYNTTIQYTYQFWNNPLRFPNM